MGIVSKIAVLLLVASLGFAQTTYYISTSDGDNSNNGTSSVTPWQTVDTLQTLSDSFFQPGDSILLKRGDTFGGSLITTLNGSPGSPIVIGAYGTGDKPILNGNTLDIVAGRAWTAVPGRSGYYYKFMKAITAGDYFYEIYGGASHIMTDIADVGDQNFRNAWLDSLDAGEFGPKGWTDTVWIHTHDSGTMDSIVFALKFGLSPNTGSNDFIVRDLEIRNYMQGIMAWSDTNGTFRNIKIVNSFQKSVQIGATSYNILVDSCYFDSSGTTSLYFVTSSNCVARYDTIVNVQDTIRGIPASGDQQGIGIQGRSSGNPPGGPQGKNNLVEYCHVEDVLGSLVDWYFNLGDTIRYNIGVNCAGISPHGTNIIVDHNTVELRDNSSATNIENIAVSDSTIWFTNNRFTNVTENGLAVSLNSVGPVVLYGNTIIGVEPDVYLLWYSSPDSVSSYSNTYYGDGVWRIGSYLDPTDYSTLGELQAATTFEDGSTWADEEPSGTGNRTRGRIFIITGKR